jgi:hypothetical protein
MTPILRFLLTVAVNGVAAAGFLLGDWSTGTTLLVYWVETLAGSLLMGVRISLHQHWTHKRGHYRTQVEMTIRSGGKTTQTVRPSTFANEFLLASLLFTLAHGIFLAALLFIMRIPVTWAQVRQGAGGVLLFLALAFLLDLPGLRYRSFAWVKGQAGAMLGRVVLIHLALIAGVFSAGISGDNRWIFLPFALFKLAVDLLRLLPAPAAGEEPPGWLLAFIALFPKQGDSFRAYWQHAQETTDREAAEDEEIQPTSRT